VLYWCFLLRLQEFLRGQIAGVNEIKGDVDGVIEKMVAQMERAVTADLPFQRDQD